VTDKRISDPKIIDAKASQRTFPPLSRRRPAQIQHDPRKTKIIGITHVFPNTHRVIEGLGRDLYT